jgi:hypothetical protein
MFSPDDTSLAVRTLAHLRAGQRRFPDHPMS